MRINNLIKARLSTGIYTFYKQSHLPQLISIYNQTKTKAGDRINKKFIRTSFRRTMIYLKMDPHIWISCTGWSASPLLTIFPVSRL